MRGGGHFFLKKHAEGGGGGALSFGLVLPRGCKMFPLFKRCVYGGGGGGGVTCLTLS